MHYTLNTVTYGKKKQNKNFGLYYGSDMLKTYICL